MSSREPAALEKYFLCIAIGIELCLKKALLNIMHNAHGDERYVGFPEEPKELCRTLSVKKSSGNLSLLDVEWKLLCPESGETDVESFDMSLIVLVLLYGMDLPPDYKEYCELAQEFRTKFKDDLVNDNLTESGLLLRWNKLEKILQGVKYNDMDLFHSLYKSEAYKSYMGYVRPDVKEETIKRVENLETTADRHGTQIQHHDAQIQQLKRDQKDHVKKVEIQNLTGKLFFFF